MDMKQEMRIFLAEFCATMLFVFFGAGSVSAAIRATNQAGPVEPVNYALSFGFAITALASSIGDVSGGHINPAITLSMAISQPSFGFGRAALMMVGQFLGGLLGGGFLCAATGGYGNDGAAPTNSKTYYSGIGINGQADKELHINSGEAFLFEFFGTLVLLFTVYNTAHWATNAPGTDLHKNTLGAIAPIPIGLAVTVSHLTLGPFTGCGINPARVLGAVVWEEGFWDGDAGKWFWVYFIGPFAASVVAPLLYFALYGTMKPGSESQSDGRTKVAVKA